MRGSSKKKRGNWFSRMWRSVQRSAPKVYKEVGEAVEEVSEAVVNVRDLSSMTRSELRSVAKKRGIKKWYDLNKKQLVEALSE